MRRLREILKARDLTAVLGRDVPVRVVDISVSGCRLESPRRFDTGTTGALSVTVDDLKYSDDIRVMRCHSLDGASGLYDVGVEFLWTTAPREQSLRRVLPKLKPEALRDVRLEAIRRM
jgi:hypothetical protein